MTNLDLGEIMKSKWTKLLMLIALYFCGVLSGVTFITRIYS